VAAAFRDDWARIVAALIRMTGDWDAAEDAAQDAFGRALTSWPRQGIPRRPGAWLTTVARNQAIDRLRRNAVGAAKLQEVATFNGRDEPGSRCWGIEYLPSRRSGAADAGAVEDLNDIPAPGLAPSDVDPSGVDDDRLRLIFTCCHPALSLDAQVALTLRTLAGLTTTEIAHAFLVTETTMAQRLVRAKRKIRHAGIPFRVPPAHLLPERTSAVLAVLYLLFNEGYAASGGTELVRSGLCAEAVRLARTLTELMPDEPEALGLLSLMLLHEARRGARVDGHGDLVPLEEQDRSRWDREAIREGLSWLDRAVRRRRPGPYQVQAAIAGCHAESSSPAETDWRQIAALYRQLTLMTRSPVVELNLAVAEAMADGPEAGLARVAALEASGRLAGYHLLAATRADLLRRLGRRHEAAAAYRDAIALAGSGVEQRYLTRRLAEVADSPS
jgi:RNA polymerase sigma-70 factor, ECF subfamily